jgi:hypothetical protein
MIINTGQLLSPHDNFLIQKYLENRYPRMATLILFLACRKAYPSIDSNRLYRICYYKIQTKIKPNRPI